MTQTIAIGADAFALDWLTASTDGQRQLEIAYGNGDRPLCKCMASGIGMYIGCRNGTYYLARMPGTGILHAPGCQSGEDESNLLSAVDTYSPIALTETPHGEIQVLFNPSSRVGHPPLPCLSYPGLLSLLIEQSNLHVMRPGEDRRWETVSPRLARAAEAVKLAPPGGSVSPCQVFVPPAYTPDAGTQLSLQAEAALKESRFVLAPLKEISPSQFGWRLVLRHLPQFSFWAGAERADLVMGASDGTIDFKEAPERSLALLEIRPGRKPHSYVVQGLAICRTDRRYMPSLSGTEDEAADWLSKHQMIFMRPLRFDAPWYRLLASYAILSTNLSPASTVYIDAPSGSKSLDDALRKHLSMLDRNGLQPLLWREGSWRPGPPGSA